MARSNLLDVLYSKNRTALDFNFDNLTANSLYNYLSPYDIAALYDIATSTSLAAKIEYKYKEINRIMVNRNFKKFAGGTNRVVYSYLEDQSFVVKIAIDKVGLGDNPAEFKNQFLLKPFVTKVFEVTPCGTVGMFERVLPITNIREYASIADDVFDLIVNKIIGKYVVDDIGTNYFMNIGIRNGFGPCLLDFPYVFELDDKKLYCNKKDLITGQYCGGIIDYDAGFNNLVCTKCGKKYIAKELESNKEQKLILIKGDKTMKVSLIREDGTVICSSEKSSDFIQKPERKRKVAAAKGSLKVSLVKETKKEVASKPRAPRKPRETKEKLFDPSLIKEEDKRVDNVHSKFIPKAEDVKPVVTSELKEETKANTPVEEDTKYTRNEKGQFKSKKHVDTEEYDDDEYYGSDYMNRKKKTKQVSRKKARTEEVLDNF